MRNYTIITVLLASICPVLASAEDARIILETMQQKQIERWEGVNSYAVDQSVMSQRVRILHERSDVEGADGSIYPVFTQVQRRGTQGPTSALMSSYADGLETTGDALGGEVENGLEDAGLPRGLFKGMGGDPWVSMDPRTMMGGMAKFARAAGETKTDETNLDAASRQQGVLSFADRAQLLGTEKVDGREAFHLIAEGINQVQQADGEVFELQTLDIWIDATEYVPLRMRVSGVSRSADETRAITIEKFDSDYRRVAGSGMYEPYRQVMRLAGMMSAEQRQEMQHAQQQMADLDAQLAQLPPAQREMFASRVGPQLEMMKRMASGGGMEMILEVQQIVVNPDSAVLYSPLRQASAATDLLPAVAEPTTTAPAAPVVQPAAAAPVLPAEQECLDQRALQTEKAQKTRRGFGRLLGAASRVAGRFGSVAATQVINDVYTAGETTADVTAAASDLGLTPDDLAACKNQASTNGNQG